MITATPADTTTAAPAPTLLIGWRFTMMRSGNTVDNTINELWPEGQGDPWFASEALAVQAALAVVSRLCVLNDRYASRWTGPAQIDYQRRNILDPDWAPRDPGTPADGDLSVRVIRPYLYWQEVMHDAYDTIVVDGKQYTHRYKVPHRTPDIPAAFRAVFTVEQVNVRIENSAPAPTWTEDTDVATPAEATL